MTGEVASTPFWSSSAKARRRPSEELESAPEKEMQGRGRLQRANSLRANSLRTTHLRRIKTRTDPVVGGIVRTSDSPSVCSDDGGASPMSSSSHSQTVMSSAERTAAAVSKRPPSPSLPSSSSSSPTSSTPTPYIYQTPINSPLYHFVIRPLCKHIVLYIPKWCTPDCISFLGLLLSVLAVICARTEAHCAAALLWWGYSLCDNLDGYQARRLHLSSRGGEFLDHAADSVVASLAVFVFLDTLVPQSMICWSPVFAILCGVMPFYIGCWAHHVLGRVLLGAVVSGGMDLVTVDEYNVLFIPGLCFLRGLKPEWLDRTLIRGPPGTGRFLDHSSDDITIGMAVLIVTTVLCVISCSSVVLKVYCPKVRLLLLPGVVFALGGILLRPPILIIAPCFSMLAFELISLRLHLSYAKTKRLWWPVLLLWLAGAFAMSTGIRSKWGLRSLHLRLWVIGLGLMALSLLIRFRADINCEMPRAKTPPLYGSEELLKKRENNDAMR